MGHQFTEHDAAEVPASPEEVWAAIATGPGIDSWFMGRNEVKPGADGIVRTVFGDYAPESPITEWDPARRFGYRSGQAPDGRFIAFEYLIEGRAGGSTVLRAVTSGFIPGDDWADEFEAMKLGGALYFASLVEYLTHFPGRFAAPVTAYGPPDPDWPRDRARLYQARIAAELACCDVEELAAAIRQSHVVWMQQEAARRSGFRVRARACPGMMGWTVSCR